MRIKVCGMRAQENILALKALPLDYMGFIFYKDSKRDVGENETLKTLLADENWQSPIKRVGVFVDAEIDTILHHVHDYSLDFVQLHGHESPEYCREINTLWSVSSMRSAKLIKAFSVGDASDFETVNAYQTHCQLFIFDTKGENPGGNGITFDWSLLSNYQGLIPFLLSGGIDEQHLPQIRQIQAPQLVGVDINSKFELEPALKDVEKVKRFVAQVK